MATSFFTKPANDRFRLFARQWKAESRYLSNTGQIEMLESYQSIIAMGESAIPLILEELRREPADHWFWALEAITLENPVPMESTGKVEAMAKAWIQWGIKNVYIS